MKELGRHAKHWERKAQQVEHSKSPPFPSKARVPGAAYELAKGKSAVESVATVETVKKSRTERGKKKGENEQEVKGRSIQTKGKTMKSTSKLSPVAASEIT